VGGDSGDGELGPDEPAVGGADLPFGRFGHHGAVDADLVEVRERFLDAEAGEFLVGDGGHDDLTVDAGVGRIPASDEGSSEAGLHVVGAAGVEPVTLDARREAIEGAGQADGVKVAAQQQPAATVVAAAAHDDAGPSGGALEYLDAQAGAASPPRDVGGYLRLARTGWVKAGIDRVDAD